MLAKQRRESAFETKEMACAEAWGGKGHRLSQEVMREHQGGWASRAKRQVT